MGEKQLELKVIEESLHLLDEQSKWKKESEYKEVCPQENSGSPLTLGCTLETAQLKHRGEKKSRSKEMRTIRRKIYGHFFWRAGLHPVTYFNRNKKTTYEDVIFILEEVRKKLE